MMQRDILLVQTLEPSPALAWKLLGCDGPHLGVHRAGPGAAPISRPISAQLTELGWRECRRAEAAAGASTQSVRPLSSVLLAQNVEKKQRVAQCP